MMCSERRLGNIIGVHPDLVIAAAQVQLSKKHRALEFIQQFLDDGDGKHLPHCFAVEGAIVYTKPPGAVTLANEKHR